jgi:hypothetical protein
VWSHKGPTLKGIRYCNHPDTELRFPGPRSDTFWTEGYSCSSCRVCQTAFWNRPVPCVIQWTLVNRSAVPESSCSLSTLHLTQQMCASGMNPPVSLRLMCRYKH